MKTESDTLAPEPTHAGAQTDKVLPPETPPSDDGPAGSAPSSALRPGDSQSSLLGHSPSFEDLSDAAKVSEAGIVISCSQNHCIC